MRLGGCPGLEAGGAPWKMCKRWGWKHATRYLTFLLDFKMEPVDGCRFDIYIYIYMYVCIIYTDESWLN